MTDVAETPIPPRDGPFSAARWRARLRRVFAVETLLLVRRDFTEPSHADDPAGEDVVFRRATIDDLELWRPECAHKIAGYDVRLRQANPFCLVGTVADRMVCYCWFATDVYDDRSLGYTFRVGARGAYMYEGWVSPALRKKGIANAFLRWIHTHALPDSGHTHVVSYFDVTNQASRRLHEHFGFVPLGRLVHVRILGWNCVFERGL